MLRLEELDEGEGGLHSPQFGAIHAVLGDWTTKRSEPAAVVMPTGTGKTKTMLGLLVAARPGSLLVIAPSDALRDHVAGKCDRLGVLQELGINAPGALRPVVGRVGRKFSAEGEAVAFAFACNVVVSTPAALQSCTSKVRAAFLSEFSHLFVDEAHHVAASTWTDIRGAFTDNPVVQFTATPLREDGNHQALSTLPFLLRPAIVARARAREAARPCWSPSHHDSGDGSQGGPSNDLVQVRSSNAQLPSAVLVSDAQMDDPSVRISTHRGVVDAGDGLLWRPGAGFQLVRLVGRCGPM